MDNIIVTTPHELEALMAKVLDSRIAQLGVSSPSTSPKEIIDTDTLCQRLGITEPTAIRHRKRGLIPFLTIGSAVRFNWDEVLKALENKKPR